MQQVNNWDLWKRMLINIEKSLLNDEVSILLNKHYKYLHSRLVKEANDEDIFNDTFLKMSYNYNPDLDFIDLYCYYFNLLKGAYYRDSKITNWLVLSIEDNPVEIADIIDEPDKVITKDDYIVNLKEKLNASIKETRKNKKKNN